MKIPIAKPFLFEEEAKAAYDTILSGWVTQGPKVQEFEEKFATYVGSKYAVALTNCTTALHLALLVAGIKECDEVICPSMSFIATANAIRYLGAIPVFAEVNEDYNINIEHTEKQITEKTKAILIVHQIGMPADIDAFKVLCQKYNIKLIEDAACAIGSSYKGEKIGSHSELVCFSFHPRKVITTGEGGMIATSNKEYYERLKQLRQHSMSINDQLRHNSDKVMIEEYLELGFNYRMTDIQASIGIKQLERIENIVAVRKQIAKTYCDELKDINLITLPIERDFASSNYQSFSILLSENCSISRNDLMQKLLEEGISTRRGIMTIHREKFYSESYSNINLPITEKLSDNSILLPLYNTMTTEEIFFVISSLRKFLR